MKQLFTILIMTLFIMPSVITGSTVVTKSSCTVTALKNEDEKHAFVWVRVKDPTYTEEGEDREICSVCGAEGRSRAAECLDVNQTYVAVKGIVRDSNGNVLANSLVKLHSMERITYTDENGYYQFNNVELGEHALQFYAQDDKKDLVSSVKLIIQTESASSKVQYLAEGHKVFVNVKGADVIVDLNDESQKTSTSVKTGDTFRSTPVFILLLGLALLVFSKLRITRGCGDE